jgi:hypothetical protein
MLLVLVVFELFLEVFGSLLHLFESFKQISFTDIDSLIEDFLVSLVVFVLLGVNDLVLFLSCIEPNLLICVQRES